MTTNPPDSSDSSTHSSTFSLISSLRFDADLPSAVRQHAGTSYPEPHDSPYYLLRYHRDRLVKAATNFQWPKAIQVLQQPLEQFTRTLDSFIPDRSKAWRLRVVVDIEGRCSVDVYPATPWPLQGMFLPASFDDLALLNPSFPWRLAVDPERTCPSPFTTYKTTSRSHYEAARQRVGIKSPMDPTEVLLVNHLGEVMEGSITTVYFRRRQHDRADATTEWVTPPLDSGCMVSVSRQYALDYELCTEKTIRLDELVDGEQCLLSNGVRGFIPALLDLKTMHYVIQVQLPGKI